MDIRPITFHELMAQAGQLMVDHWREVESSFWPEPPQIQGEIYLGLEAMGSLICLGAFDADGALCGYVVVNLLRHPHYGCSCAFHDSMYLAPEHRKGRVGIRLIRLAEEEARRRGAKRIAWTGKRGSTFAKLMERLIGPPSDVVFFKEL